MHKDLPMLDTQKYNSFVYSFKRQFGGSEFRVQKFNDLTRGSSTFKPLADGGSHVQISRSFSGSSSSSRSTAGAPFKALEPELGDRSSEVSRQNLKRSNRSSRSPVQTPDQLRGRQTESKCAAIRLLACVLAMLQAGASSGIFIHGRHPSSKEELW